MEKTIRRPSKWTSGSRATPWGQSSKVLTAPPPARATFITGPGHSVATPCPTFDWAAVPGDDEAFARDLFAAAHVTVLPGSYLSREAHGANPGKGYVRIALVSTVAEAAEAGRRIAEFVRARSGAAAPLR